MSDLLSLNKVHFFVRGVHEKLLVQRGHCLKSGAWTVFRFRGGLEKKEEVMFLRGIDTPRCTLAMLYCIIIASLLGKSLVSIQLGSLLHIYQVKVPKMCCFQEIGESGLLDQCVIIRIGSFLVHTPLGAWPGVGTTQPCTSLPVTFSQVMTPNM